MDTVKNVITSHKKTSVLYLVLVAYIYMSNGSENKWALTLLRNREFKLLFMTIVFGLSFVNRDAAMVVGILYIAVTMSLAQTESFSTFTSTPGPELAISTVANTVTADPQNVNSMASDPSVTVITPTVTDGVLSNPNVVVAPVMVVNEAGQEVVVTPNLLVLDPQTCYPDRVYDHSKVVSA